MSACTWGGWRRIRLCCYALATGGPTKVTPQLMIDSSAMSPLFCHTQILEGHCMCSHEDSTVCVKTANRSEIDLLLQSTSTTQGFEFTQNTQWAAAMCCPATSRQL